MNTEKNFISFLILFILNITVCSNGELVSMWEFEQDVNDSSGNGINCKIVKEGYGFTMDLERGGRVLSITDANTYIETLDEGDFDRTKFTICGWIKGGNQKTWTTIFCKWGAWKLCKAGTYNYLGIYINDQGQVWNTSTIFDDEWHFIAVTYDGAQLALYVDGSRNTGTVGAPSQNSTPLRVGGNANLNESFVGKLDKVMYFNHALTLNQINQIRLQPNLSGAWDFEGSCGDVSGKLNDGTLMGTGSQYIFDSERDEWVLSLNGNGWVQVANESNFDLESALTITAWVKADANNLLDWTPVVSKFQAWSLAKHWYTTWTGGYVEPSRGTYNTNNGYNGEWHFIAMTYDSTYDGNNLSTYVDQTKNTKKVTGSIITNNNPLRLGGTSSVNLVGYIDDIKIYPCSLSDVQIRTQHSTSDGNYVMENMYLKVTIDNDNGKISIYDKQADYTWVQPENSYNSFTNISTSFETFSCSTILKDNNGSGANKTVNLTLRLPSQEKKLYVNISGSFSFTDSLVGIDPFKAPNTSDSSIIVTDWTGGNIYPSDILNLPGQNIENFSVDMLQLPWIGVVDVASGLGYGMTIKTSDDAILKCVRPSGQSRRVPRIYWKSQKNYLGYARSLVFDFTSFGGYVALAKELRKYMDDHGYVKTFFDKSETRPDVMNLMGAPYIWNYFGFIDWHEMQTLGVSKGFNHINNLLYTNNSTPTDMTEVNDMKLHGWVAGEYQVYADAFDTNEAHPTPEPLYEYENNFMLDKNQNIILGWSDIRGQEYVRCTSILRDRAEDFVPDIIDNTKMNGVYLDVTPVKCLYECWHTSHPRTRTECKDGYIDLMEYFADAEDLVVSGENGKWWGVPYLDVPKGLMSDMVRPWLSSPVDEYNQTEFGNHTTTPQDWNDYETYGSLGHKYRLPLWQLVFHDCTSTVWYQSDCVDYTAYAEKNSTFPFSYMEKKALISLLYGSVPTFGQIDTSGDVNTSSAWTLNRQSFMEIYRNTCKVHEIIGDQKLLSHKFLTSNRDVQQTVWEDGTIIIVNFGSNSYETKVKGTTYLLYQFGFIVNGPQITMSKAYSSTEGRIVTRISRPDEYEFTDADNGVPVSMLKIDSNTIRVTGDYPKQVCDMAIKPKNLISDWDFNSTELFICDRGNGTRMDFISRWKFNGDLADSIANNNGTFSSGTPTYSYDVERGSQVLYTSTGNWIIIGNESNFDFTDSFTICGWIKSNSTNIANFTVIACKYGSWQLDVGNSFIRGSINGEEITDIIYDDVNDLKWHFVAMSYDGTRMNVYFDGKRKWTEKLSTSMLVQNNNPIRLGGNTYTNWDGYLDDFRIYHNVLSKAELERVRTEPKLVGYWKFDQNLNDTSINANNGSISGGTGYAYVNDPERGYVLSLTDDDTFVTIPNVNRFDFTNQFTITAWIKNPDFNQSIATWGGIVTKFGSWSINNASNWQRIGSYIGNSHVIDSQYLFANEDWHFIATAYDGANLSLYVDGIKTSVSNVVSPNLNGSPVRIGGTGNVNESAKLYFDDVAIYSNALSEQQILEISKYLPDPNTTIIIDDMNNLIRINNMSDWIVLDLVQN